MLTKEQIQANKERYIELIKGITTDGADIERFLKWAEKSDFFTAPASTKYHANYEGGLCQHSLNVYDNLKKLVKEFAYHVEYEESGGGQESAATLVSDFSEDSIRTVALLHDLAKVNFYETYFRNVNTGEKDSKGKDIWERVQEYKTRAPEERFLFGNHEQNSEYMAHTFFPLTVEESVAILNHHGGKGFDSAQTDLTPIYNRFTLALLLHMADMASTFISEKLVEDDK